VGILSNFLGRRDGREEEPPAIIRPAYPSELKAAVRLLLGTAGQTVADEQVNEFMAFVEGRAINAVSFRVAEQAGKLTAAAMPVVSPGRTMLLFASPPTSGVSESVLSRVIDGVCAGVSDAEAHLAQVLIEPTDDAMQRIYEAAGFEVMAELIYLHGTPRADAPFPVLPPGWRWEHYSAASHDQFVETIHASYQHSLDCPALNGMRDMHDVLEGHKASGVFDPNHWFLLLEGHEPRGVLLLASSGRDAAQMELVYLGVPESSRGKKLGEILMRQAMATVAAAKHERLALAVDEKNIPALKLYYRNGMNRLTSKLAMMRDLRKKFIIED
jgi:GNAT superfamily N-acetyltransferase